MLSSIHPFGERTRNGRWWITVTAYVFASTLAGAVVGIAGGFAGQVATDAVPSAWLAGLFALAALGAALADAGVAGFGYPSPRRQVNEVWLSTYRGWVYGLGFGFQLGLGIATIVTTATVWLMLAATVLVGSWWQGLVIGAVFGCSRAALILATAGVHSPEQLRALHRRIAATGPIVERMATAVAGAAAAIAAAGVIAS